MQIKISQKIFECLHSSVQLSFGSHATVDLTFDLNSCKCYDYFIKLAEIKNRFDLESQSFLAKGCQVKSVDINYKQGRMNISLHTDVLLPVDIKERRDDSINDILTKTFTKDNDIN